MRRLVLVLTATAALGACGADERVADVAGDDATENADGVNIPDASVETVPEVEPPACSTPVCLPPCVFDFRDVAADRDGVSEVRIAAVETSGAVLAVTLSATPSWIRFSDGFAQYITRVTGGDWVVAADRLSVAAGAPIRVPAGESFVVELRADDPGAATCASGSCGTVTVKLGDCALGQAELVIAVIR